MADLYSTKILELKSETPSVLTIHFEKPAGFEYKAGQFVDLQIPESIIPMPNNKKNFTLASAPHEPYLQVTFRHGISPFKSLIQDKKTEAPISFTGPYGKFFLNEDVSIPAVMLTGGIGITPFHSMIKFATEKKIPKKITLVYSNKTPDDIPFKDELDQLDQMNEHLTIYHTITRAENIPAGFSWSGRRGRIDEAMIRELVPDIMGVEYYVVGPVKMVLAIKATLKQMGILPDRIHSELFTGYAE